MIEVLALGTEGGIQRFKPSPSVVMHNAFFGGPQKPTLTDRIQATTIPERLACVVGMGGPASRKQQTVALEEQS